MASSLTAGKSRFLASPVKQVTKSNFTSSLQQFKSDLQSAEFISISLLKTGSFSLPWLRILPFDSPETTYLKSKLSAESFQPLLFSACPFSHSFASPYNFHLFPQHNTFSCHAPSLSSMARGGFDFNACFHDGLSYLSRVQEADAKRRKFGSWMHPSSLADSIFKERVKSRLAHWRKACQDGSFAQSLRRVLLGGGEDYGSRPGIGIDVCSERQAQLVFESADEVSDELVAVLVGGDKAAVRVVLTSSEEDKRVLLTELQNAEDEENLKLRGFRQVIDLISGSHKTVVSANWLHDLAFVHAKFVGPLPATLPEFMCSLRLLFSNVVDLNHLLREFGGGLGRAKNVSSALSCLKRRCFVPMEVEVVGQGEGGKKRFHGSNVLRLGFLFAKLNVLLKNGSPALEHAGSIEDYANAFNPALLTLGESGDDDDETGWCIDAARRVRTDNMLFLWGFGGANSAVELKRRLLRIHPVLSEEFDVHLVNKTCAVVVFGRSGSAETLVEDMSSVDAVSGVLREMVVEGLRAAGYDAYLKVCRLGLWEGDLADSLEIALAETVEDLSRTNTYEMNWNNEMMVDLNDL